jgi:putative nucleotidyltransferase with HDIG domain
MVVAEDVYTYNNQLVLLKDTELTDKAITKLEFYSIISVRIKDDSTPASVEPNIPQEEMTYSQRIKSSEEYKVFKAEFERSVDDFKGKVNRLLTVSAGTTINTEELLEDTNELLEKAPSGLQIFDMLHNMRMYDDPTFAHCMNVALICHVFGTWLGMPDRDVDTLTVAGLLHDVGKLKIPETILGKPARLTDDEYTVIKTHTVEGYNILKDLEIDAHIKSAALMHHERCDGSGYPLGLTTDRIDSFARIVAIADVYDAMTAARVYRGPLCPFKVIGIFESEGLNKYDSHFILIFLEHIASTYIKNRVRLSNGMEGEVVFMNKTALSRPMIQCRNRFVDLSKETDIYIETFV